MNACVLIDGDLEIEVTHGTDAWRASMEWARFHGLEPNWIPAGSEIVRDAANCCIRYEEFVFDGERGDYSTVRIEHNEPLTRLVVEQGEAPPLPFPAEVLGS